MKYPNVDAFIQWVASRNPAQPEFLQAVTEVLHSLWPFLLKNPQYAEQALLERLGARSHHTVSCLMDG